MYRRAQASRCILRGKLRVLPGVNIYKGQSQVGSLAGAAHLLNDNAGVLWRAQTERKSVVEQKGKSSLNDDFQYEYSLRNHGLSILSLKIFFDL